jgi:hypothetical protein
MGGPAGLGTLYRWVVAHRAGLPASPTLSMTTRVSGELTYKTSASLLIYLMHRDGAFHPAVLQPAVTRSAGHAAADLWGAD